MNTALTIAQLTLKETQRLRILWVGILMGGGFLALYGIGFHYINVEFETTTFTDAEEYQIVLNFLTLAGLLVTNFLVVILSVLISVSGIASEIDNHTVDAIITKPIRRWEVIFGKWLGYAVMVLGCIIVLPGGILLIVYLRAGFTMSNVIPSLALMFLEGVVMMTVSVAGGTRLSTMANGAVAFMMYGFAFIGSWVEQIGALFQNETAVNVGIISSLLSPTEILWRKATTLLQPQVLNGFDFVGPFAAPSEPNTLMIVYAILYIAICLGWALWSFTKRDL